MTEAFMSSRGWRRRWIAAAIAGLVLIYLASGIYFVQPDERGVVRWFGRVSAAGRSVPPGLHYAMPWPFCRVNTPKTSEVRRIYVGLTPAEREAILAGEAAALERSPESDTLSGDVNILKTTMVVQYQVIDPLAYLFGTREPDRLVHDAVQSTLVELLAGMPVDQALTAAKSQLQIETLGRSQARLDAYGCGVRLVSTDLEALEPPRAIIDAFQEVVSAKKDGEKAVDYAVAEANRVLPRARGEAMRLREEALGYHRERVSRARGESARFESLLVEYRRAPELLRQRLLLQTMEAVLPRIKTYILDEQPGDSPTNVRIIDTTK